MKTEVGVNGSGHRPPDGARAAMSPARKRWRGTSRRQRGAGPVATEGGVDPRPGRLSQVAATLYGPGLRLPRHRATTAHLCSAYPFQAAQGLGGRGVYLGTDELAGGGAFCFDAFELYTQGVLNSPNLLVVGDVGAGKSSAVKCLLARSVGVFRSPGGGSRWVAIVDPKGEYHGLAEYLGLEVLRINRGGSTRLNPLDAGPAGDWGGSEELVARRTTLVGALVAAVLRRELSPLEDAVVGWAVAEVSASRLTAPTLGDVAHLIGNPTREMAERAHGSSDELARSVDAARYALGKLLDRDLRGMFDGPTTARIDWSGRGIVLDLSAVHQDPDALTLVMIATTAWLQAALAAPESATVPRRYQVLEECWALLGSERVAKYLQACWKLSRAYGVSNIAVCHRIADLKAQADDGTATAKVAMGLLADTQTRILFRQPTDQVGEATSLLGLTSTEASLLPRLARGRALWKVATHTAVVQHVVGPSERGFCDTDARLVV